ncbi:MAG TPA: hypothetical protein VF142_23070 [Longimicrobium sp.]
MLIQAPDAALRQRAGLVLFLMPWVVDAVLFYLMLRSPGRRPRLACIAVLYVVLNVAVPAVAAFRWLGWPPLGILGFLALFRGLELEVVGLRRLFVDLWRVRPAE